MTEPDPGPCTLIYRIWKPSQRNQSTRRIQCQTLAEAWAKRKELQSEFERQGIGAVWRIEGADGLNLPTEPDDPEETTACQP